MNHAKLHINHLTVDRETGQIFDTSGATEPDGQARLEPKTCELLFYLAEQDGKVCSKEELLASIWSDSVVSEDALTRSISKLRKALNDDPKKPKIIETIPKRGYRLIAQQVRFQSDNTKITASSNNEEGTAEASDTTAPINPAPSKVSLSSPSPTDGNDPHHSKNVMISVAVGVVAIAAVVAVIAIGAIFLTPHEKAQPSKAEQLVHQADDFYAQIRRADNEAAIELYQQAIALEPDLSSGQAGLANALVQKVIRWPNPADEPEIPHTNLEQAITQGRTATSDAKLQLERAQALAEGAVRMSPNNHKAYKSLGFVYSAQGKFDQAIHAYQKSVELNPNAWDSLINIGDVLEITDQHAEALNYFEQAHAAMTRVYQDQAARIRPWYADMGALIGEKHLQLGNKEEAEIWFRRVLGYAPLNERATLGLAQLLRQSGDPASARRLCRELIERVGDVDNCEN